MNKIQNQPMFIIYYKNSKLDKLRTVRSYTHYVMRYRSLPRFTVGDL